MKNLSVSLIITVAITTILSTQTAFAGISEDRQARMQKIEALYFIIRDGRIDRSKRVQAKLDLARLQAEMRKGRRAGNQRRDRLTGIQQRSY